MATPRDPRARDPLARVASLRAEAAAAQVRALADALAAEADAEAALADADAAVARALARLQAAPALADAAPAWQLIRGDAYRARLVRDLAAARDRHAARAAALATRRLATAAARDRTAAARAEREVVDRHRAGWADAQRKLRERADD